MFLLTLWQNNFELLGTLSGSIVLLIFMVIFYFAYFLYIGKVQEAIFTLITPISYFYSILLKGYFKLPRPSNFPQIYQRFNADIYGFPSSHTVVFTVFWGFLLYLTFFLDGFKNSIFSSLTRFISIAFLLIIGFSRVYFGYHSALDVFGGYIFGGLFLALLILIQKNEWLKIFSKNKEKNN